MPSPLHHPTTYVDATTGEAITLQAVPARRHLIPGGFAMTTLRALDAIAQEGWTATDYQTFLALLGRLDYDNHLHVSVTELAAHIGRPRQNVSASIRRLVERGHLHRGPRVGNATTYRLDPSVAWRGQPADRDRYASELAAERGWEVIDGDA